MGNRVVMASFLGCLALITYRDFKHPDSTWPLGPVPPPYRFTWAAVVFAIISLVSDLVNPRVASVVAGGVLLGTAYDVITGQSALAGLKSNAPNAKSEKNQSGATGTTAMGTTEQV